MMSRLRGRNGRPTRPQAPRTTRLACEPLEGRALMAASLLNPSFGRFGVASGAVDTGTQLSNVTAVAVQPDGKVVVAGTYSTGNPAASPATYPLLAVARYNASGTIDTSFGTNGQLNIPLPAGSLGVYTAPHNIVVSSTGVITLAASVAVPVTTPNGIATQQEGLVARVTAAGTLDPTFATGGEFFLPVTVGGVSAVVAQTDGKIVAAGGSTASDQFRVIRLTTAGALDPTFNNTGTLNVSLATATSTVLSSVAAGLALTSTGQIYAAGDAVTLIDANTNGNAPLLTRITSTGTLDTTYGSLGTNRSVGVGSIGDIAVQSSGSVVVAGATAGTPTGPSSLALVRLTPTGAVDTTFAGLGRSTSPTPLVAGSAFTSIALGTDGTITAVGGSARGPNTVGLVDRFKPNGDLDATFGKNGQYSYLINPPGGYAQNFAEAPASVALAAGGGFVVAGTLTTDPGVAPTSTRRSYVALLRSAPTASTSNQSVAGDYDGDGKADIAVYLPAAGAFAIIPSGGKPAAITPFGGPGFGAAIPAPGDYDGDGKTDLAVYLPAYGILAYRPSSGGPDVLTPFGAAGPGGSIPAPGDYDGDGKADIAIYLPAAGAFAIIPSGGKPAAITPFGGPGFGAAIPAPGDYDGDGKTDLAVYLPAYGILAYRPSSGGPDVLTPFGAAGPGGSIPAPGDYDGDGKADIAIYLPAAGAFAIIPSGGKPAAITPYGGPGSGVTIPAPGDYDGDGKIDLSAYLPGYGLYASRPSGGGHDVLTPFGSVGIGQTIPAASIPYAFGGTVSSSSLRGSAAAGDYLVALTDDLLPPSPGSKKPHA